MYPLKHTKSDVAASIQKPAKFINIYYSIYHSIAYIKTACCDNQTCWYACLHHTCNVYTSRQNSVLMFSSMWGCDRKPGVHSPLLNFVVLIISFNIEGCLLFFRAMLLQEGTSMHWHATKCAIDSAGEQVLQQMKAELSWLLKQLSERQSTGEGQVGCAQMQFENAKSNWGSSGGK